MAVAFVSVLTPVHGQNYTIGLSSEMAYTADISLTDSEMFVRRRDSKREVTLFLGAAEIDLDYRPRPANLLGIDKNLSTLKQSGLITWREGLDQRLQWSFSGGVY